MVSISQIFQIIAALAAIVSIIYLYRKDAKYIGNQLMILTMISLILYAISTFIYDILGIGIVILILVRVGVLAGMFAGYFVYLSMQTMVNSSLWFDEKKNWLPHLIILIIISLYFIFSDSVDYTLLPEDGVNVIISMSVTIITGIPLFLFVLISIIIIIRNGIQKTTGILQSKMKIFRNGLMIIFIAIVIVISSNFVAEAIGIIFDSLTFLLMGIGSVLMTIGFILNPEVKR